MHLLRATTEKTSRADANSTVAAVESGLRKAPIDRPHYSISQALLRQHVYLPQSIVNVKHSIDIVPCPFIVYVARAPDYRLNFKA